MGLLLVAHVVLGCGGLLPVSLSSVVLGLPRLGDGCSSGLFLPATTLIIIRHNRWPHYMKTLDDIWSVFGEHILIFLYITGKPLLHQEAPPWKDIDVNRLPLSQF